jgi:hypothetical protein
MKQKPGNIHMEMGFFLEDESFFWYQGSCLWAIFTPSMVPLSGILIPRTTIIFLWSQSASHLSSSLAFA